MVAVFACCLLCACEFDAFILDVGILPGARENAVAACCACLAGTRRDDVAVSTSGAACGENAPMDAGIMEVQSDCICALPQSTCETQLLAGQRISLRGECTATDGVCSADCENVLAYPD